MNIKINLLNNNSLYIVSNNNNINNNNINYNNASIYDLSKYNSSYFNILIYYVNQNDLDSLKTIDFNSYNDIDIYYSFLEALKLKFIDIIIFYIVNINLFKIDYICLSHICKLNNLDIIKYLFQYRYDININMFYNNIEELFDRNDININLIIFLFKIGFNINAINYNDQNNLLMYACKYNNENLIDLILKLSKEYNIKINIYTPNIFNENSITFLNYYSNHKYIDILQKYNLNHNF